MSLEKRNFSELVEESKNQKGNCFPYSEATKFVEELNDELKNIRRKYKILATQSSIGLQYIILNA